MPKNKSTSKNKQTQSANNLIVSPLGFSVFTDKDETGPMNQHNDFIYTGQGGGTYEKDTDDIEPGLNGFTLSTPRTNKTLNPGDTTPFDNIDKEKTNFMEDPSIISTDNGGNPDDILFSDWKGQGVTSKPPFPAGGVVPQNKYTDQANPTHFFQSGKNGNPATGVQDTKFTQYDGGLCGSPKNYAEGVPGYNSKLFETDGFTLTCGSGSSICPSVKNQVTKHPQEGANLRGDVKGPGGYGKTRSTRAFAHGFSFNVTAATQIKPVSPNTNKEEQADMNANKFVSDRNETQTISESNVEQVPGKDVFIKEETPGTTPIGCQEDIARTNRDLGLSETTRQSPGLGKPVTLCQGFTETVEDEDKDKLI